MTYYVYGYFHSREAAERALADSLANGDVSPCEISRIYPAGGKRWALELKHD